MINLDEIGGKGIRKKMRLKIIRFFGMVEILFLKWNIERSRFENKELGFMNLCCSYFFRFNL